MFGIKENPTGESSLSIILPHLASSSRGPEKNLQISSKEIAITSVIETTAQVPFKNFFILFLSQSA
jgi:hypothetical protein